MSRVADPPQTSPISIRRLEEATDRLLEIRREAQDGADAGRLEALAREIDDLAGDIAKHALERPTEARTMSAATAAIAIDVARSTVKRTIVAGQPLGDELDLAGRMTSTGASASDAAG